MTSRNTGNQGPALDYLLSSLLRPIQEGVMSHLRPNDILALNLVSRDVRDSTQDAKIYTINRDLKIFFDHPAEFRTYQARAGALIGGDFARAFFDNAVSSINKLEIYVHRIEGKQERSCNILLGYIAQRSNGNTAVSPIDRKLHGPASLVLSKTSKTGRELTIAIYCTEVSPLYALLHNAPTTAATNFISWERAYAPFARQTFVQRAAHLL